MLTKDKMTQIAEYLNADETRAQKLTEMEAADAAAAMQADGIEITAEELKAFGEEITKAQQSSELDEAALEGVSGGLIVFPTYLGVWAARKILSRTW